MTAGEGIPTPMRAAERRLGGLRATTEEARAPLEDMIRDREPRAARRRKMV